MRKLQPICSRIILVFDGEKLPSKSVTNEQRLDSRKQALSTAKMQAAMGEDATRACQSAISFSYADIIQISQAIIEENIQNLLVLIAPYEADAQLAHLELSNVVDYIITIDSDLLLYGLKQVIYKPDFYKMTGELITFNDLFTMPNAVIKEQDIQMFRRLCILSGCDYCLSPKGIGMIKLQRMYQNGNENILQFAQQCLKSGQRNLMYQSDEEYIKMLLVSLYTFKHHIVFDFFQQKCVNRVQIKDNDQQLEQIMEQYIGKVQDIDEQKCFLNNNQRQMAQLGQKIAIPYDEQQVLDEEQLLFDGQYIMSKDKMIKYQIEKQTITRHNTSMEDTVQQNNDFQWILRFSEAKQQ